MRERERELCLAVLVGWMKEKRRGLGSRAD